MNQKRYTLTIYIAAPNTQLFNIETGLPLHEKNGDLKYSIPGHVFYAISDDGGINKKGYGFAPTPSGMRNPGQVCKDEHKEYLNPAYERTIEITQEQYEALKNFGEDAKKYGFDTDIYNAFTNSCVDFVCNALRYAKVHDAQIHDIYTNTSASFDGYIKVLPNKSIFNKIEPPFPNSDLNKIIERPLPSAPNIERAISGFILGENENVQFENNKSMVQIPSAQDLAQKLFAAYSSGDKDALSSVVPHHAYTQQRNQEVSEQVQQLKEAEQQRVAEQLAESQQVEQQRHKMVRS